MKRSGSDIWAIEPASLRGWLDVVGAFSTADSAEARRAFARIPGPGSREAVDQIYSSDGQTAVVRIEGPLTVQGPDALDLWAGVGGVAYQTIIGAMERAEDEHSVKSVIFAVNTPGGTVEGADATWGAHMRLRAAKQTSTLVTGMLASAGYYITAPSHKIYASNPTDSIGSIGVIYAAWDFTKALEGAGIKRVEIRSRNAPNKAADPATATGRDILQERLDATERIFYQRISESRGITGEQIAERFGQGALLVAKDPSPDATDAIRAGMIDGLLDGAGFGRV